MSIIACSIAACGPTDEDVRLATRWVNGSSVAGLTRDQLLKMAWAHRRFHESGGLPSHPALHDTLNGAVLSAIASSEPAVQTACDHAMEPCDSMFKSWDANFENLADPLLPNQLVERAALERVRPKLAHSHDAAVRQQYAAWESEHAEKRQELDRYVDSVEAVSSPEQKAAQSSALKDLARIHARGEP